MRIALIGDVHANLPALEAVLNDARQRGAEEIWNTGDFVGYNAFPDQVVQRIRTEVTATVIGNYDLKVLRFPSKSEKWRKKKWPEKWFAFKWTYEQLSLESREYLAALPEQRRLRTEGRDILLVHGSPVSLDEHLYVDTPEERLMELAELAEADLVVCGHSHQGFARETVGSIFVNAGSVGRPDDGDPRAAYAMLEIDGSSIVVHHNRVAYDIEAAVAEMRQHGLPSAFEEMIRQGRNLDWVIGTSNR